MKPSAREIDRVIHVGGPPQHLSRADRMRAAKILRANLTTTQAKELVNEGGFAVEGNHTGTLFRLTAARGARGLVLPRPGPAGRYPRADVILAGKLMVEFDEGLYRALSCGVGHCPCKKCERKRLRVLARNQRQLEERQRAFRRRSV